MGFRLSKVWLLTLGFLVISCGLGLANPKFVINAGHSEVMFTKAPFLSPKIIQDLSVWVSDTGDQVTSINLLDSQDSNRYFGDVKVRNPDGQIPYVYVAADKAADGDMRPAEFGYQYIGKTQSGVYVLETSDCEGGTGVFENLLLVTLEKDRGLTVDWGKKVIQRGMARFVIKKLGEIILGDRCQPEVIKVEGNSLILGKDVGVLAGQYPNFNAPQTIAIHYEPGAPVALGR